MLGGNTFVLDLKKSKKCKSVVEEKDGVYKIKIKAVYERLDKYYLMKKESEQTELYIRVISYNKFTNKLIEIDYEEETSIVEELRLKAQELIYTGESQLDEEVEKGYRRKIEIQREGNRYEVQSEIEVKKYKRSEVLLDLLGEETRKNILRLRLQGYDINEIGVVKVESLEEFKLCESKYEIPEGITEVKTELNMEELEKEIEIKVPRSLRQKGNTLSSIIEELRQIGLVSESKKIKCRINLKNDGIVLDLSERYYKPYNIFTKKEEESDVGIESNITIEEGVVKLYGIKLSEYKEEVQKEGEYNLYVCVVKEGEDTKSKKQQMLQIEERGIKYEIKIEKQKSNKK